jgi:23S rRNA (guanosine2251-2'-O)-methyltransferase
LRILVLRQDRQFANIVRLARTARIPVHIEPKQALDRLVPGGKHQGVIGVVAAKRYADPLDIVRYAHRHGEPPFLVILDGVEDPHNLGAVIRTAEAVGVHGVVLPERPGVLDKCDDSASIPMQGRVESLNVSVAGAVLMYEVLRQRMLQAKIQEE